MNCSSFLQKSSPLSRGKSKSIIGLSREKTEQRKWVIGAAVAGLVAGLALFPLLGNILPIAIGSRMAAITIGTDRWNGGMDMMADDSPGSWNFLRSAWFLAQENNDALNACRARTRETGEARNCTVSVEPGS